MPVVTTSYDWTHRPEACCRRESAIGHPLSFKLIVRFAGLTGSCLWLNLKATTGCRASIAPKGLGSSACRHVLPKLWMSVGLQEYTWPRFPWNSGSAPVCRISLPTGRSRRRDCGGLPQPQCSGPGLCSTLFSLWRKAGPPQKAASDSEEAWVV